jgi:circadian clock protein KaiC
LKAEVPRTPTGIEGLDSMIGGGIPRGRVVLVSGGPGTGKTTLAIQYLINGVLKYHENGIFVSLDEPEEKIFQEASYRGWDLRRLCHEKKIAFIDGKSYATGHKVQRFVLGQTISDTVRSMNAKRISVDTLARLTLQYPDRIQRSEVVLELFEAVQATGSTTLVTHEIKENPERAVLLEEYLADGVIILQSSQVEQRRVRTIDVEKMRGTRIDDQLRPYVLEDDGIQVLSDKDIFAYAAKLLIKK